MTLRVSIVAALLFAFAPSVAALDDMLRFTRPGEWVLDDGGRSAVFVGERDTTSLAVALADGVSIQTDADAITIMRGDRSVELELGEGEHSIVLGERLSIGGEEPARYQGEWIRLARDPGDGSARVFIRGLTFATVSVGKNVSAPAPAQTGSAVSLVEAAKSGVFRLLIHQKGRLAISIGTGVLVAPNGLALTNFHVVKGGSHGEAYFEGAPKPVAVTLWSVDPLTDLAIVQVDVAALPASVTATPLRLAQRPPAVASDVYAIGYPKNIGFTVTKGVVNGVRVLKDLPPDFANALSDYGPDSVWIQTDATINQGNSGGPLLNAAGEIVGINTWSWLSADNTYFAISSRHAAALLANSDQPSMSFERALVEFEGVDPKPFGFPNIAIAGTAPAMDLRQVAMSFRRSVICSRCDAIGKIDERVRTGTRMTPGGVKVPIYENRVASCPDCGGQRMSADFRRIQRVGLSLVERLARVAQDDPRLAETLEFCRTTLAYALNLNPDRLTFSVNDTATRSASIQSLRVGEPVLLVGTLNEDIRLNEIDERLRLVTLARTSQVFIINDPLVENAVQSEQVFVGGILAGFIPDPDGEVLPVLQSGFIVGKRSPH